MPLGTTTPKFPEWFRGSKNEPSLPQRDPFGKKEGTSCLPNLKILSRPAMYPFRKLTFITEIKRAVPGNGSFCDLDRCCLMTVIFKSSGYPVNLQPRQFPSLPLPTLHYPASACFSQYSQSCRPALRLLPGTEWLHRFPGQSVRLRICTSCRVFR